MKRTAKIKQTVCPDPVAAPGTADLRLAKSRPRQLSDQGPTWRKSDKFLLFVLVNLLLLGLMFVHASLWTKSELPWLRSEAQMVGRLGLTDLCLSTEAAYTRHPSQVDRHSPFQSHPLALDYFPTGAVVTPPK